MSRVDWFHDGSKIVIQKSTGLVVNTSYSGNITSTEHLVTKRESMVDRFHDMSQLGIQECPGSTGSMT